MPSQKTLNICPPLLGSHKRSLRHFIRGLHARVGSWRRMRIRSWSLTLRVNQSRSEIKMSLSPSQMKISHVGFERCAYDVTSQEFELDPTLFLVPGHLRIDLSHSAAMLSLRRIKSFVFARLASLWIRVWARLVVKNKAFYSPETQHGRRVRKVYRVMGDSENRKKLCF